MTRILLLFTARIRLGTILGLLVMLAETTRGWAAPEHVPPPGGRAAKDPEGDTRKRGPGDVPDLISPRSLPYYDLKWAKALTLEDMKLKVVARARKEGVELIRVSYSAFNQPFAAADGTLKTLPWRQRAVLFLPPAHPDGTAKARQAVIYNCHDAEGHRLFTEWGVGVAKAFGLPVLIHGWEPDVVKELEGRNYHLTQERLIDRLLQARIERAEDLPMDGRYLLNGWPLVKGDMVSITLLQRLVFQETGGQIEEVGALGISKEGGAHWILGAVDDRIAVLAPGGSAHESWTDLLDHYRRDWNGSMPASVGRLPLFEAVLRLGDWLAATEAGHKMDRAMSPEYWPDQIRARHVLISGDLGAVGQHDVIWPILAENRFLGRFSHPSWRYVRAYDGSGVSLNDAAGELGRSLLPHVADLLTLGTRTPSTPKVSVSEESRRLIVRAECSIDGHLRTEAVLVYIIAQDRNVCLRAKEDWKTTTMILVPGQVGQFASEALPEVPPDHAITFVVVVKELVERPPIRYWRSASSLPQEQFPRPEHDQKLPSWKMESR
jgi:hypothetical protein